MKKSPTHYKYECFDCNYYTNNRKDYNKHCTTRKHKKSQSKEIYDEFVDFKCTICKKKYIFNKPAKITCTIATAPKKELEEDATTPLSSK